MLFHFNQQMLAEMAEESISQAMNTAQSASIGKFNEIIDKIDNAMPGLIGLMTNEAEDYWINKANSIGGWGSKYARAIKSKTENGKGEVYVDESIDKMSGKPNMMFADMVEKGVRSWSIKDALLASRKAKEGKDGIKYITIPFPVSTPRKKGQGKMQSSFGGRVMTSDMQKIIKSGGKITSGTLQSGTRKLSTAGLTQFSTRKYHSQYGLFRRVSSKSQGWQYPNKAPIPTLQAVEAYMNKRVGEIMAEFCKTIVSESLK